MLPAVQQGDIPAVMRVMDQLNMTLGGMTSKGKGLAGKPSVDKKIRLDPEAFPLPTAASHDPIQTCDNHMSFNHQVLLERGINNNNIIHVCCSTVTDKTDDVLNEQSDFSSIESTYTIIIDECIQFIYILCVILYMHRVTHTYTLCLLAILIIVRNSP